MKMVKFRSWKTLKSHGKGHGKSWYFKSSKEYEPCVMYEKIVILARAEYSYFSANFK